LHHVELLFVFSNDISGSIPGVVVGMMKFKHLALQLPMLLLLLLRFLLLLLLLGKAVSTVSLVVYCYCC